jgi:putative transposase
VIGDIKGKSAIAVARQCGGRKRNVGGEKFWARGYAVSTVGFEESDVRNDIRHQEDFDKKGYDEEAPKDDDDLAKGDGRF